MRALLCTIALLFLANYSFGQKIPHIYQIRADTVRIYNTCDTAELVLENRTQDTLGFLFNKGKGRTEFRRLSLERIGSTQLAIKGQDTIDLNSTETLQTVTSRGNSTSQNILFGGTAASSAGLSWNFNTDIWKIFVESPQDTPAGDMIFESADNDQEGWIFRSKNGTTPKQVLSIQPEGIFTFLGNNILHAGNHVAGSQFSQTLTGANVFSTITTNASGHVTALTTRALTAADIGAAPATTSGNYIQNLSTGAQVANFSISGTGNAGYGFSTPLVFSNNSAGQLNLVGGATGANSLRGGEIVLLGGSWGTTPGEILFRTGTGGSGAQQPERMRIDAAGNVGINNSNPTNPLSVTGASSAITPSTITTYATRISQGGSDLGIGGDASYSYIQSFNSKPLQINNVGNNILLNAVGGNVGIGTTNPTTKLEVNGTTTVTGGASLFLKAATNDPGDLIFTDASNVEYSRIYNTAGGTALHLSTGPTPTPRLTVTSTGNVGIGTTAPTGKLEVVNGTTAEIQFAGAGVANIYQSASAQALYVNSNTGPLYLGANGSGSTHLTVLSNGNTGINNTAPAQKLEVANGNIRAHGGNVQSGPTDASVLSALTYSTGLGVVGSFTNTPFAIYTNSTEKLRIDAAGNVGIGVTAPTSKLHVAGAGLFTGQVQATSFFQSSLRSLKKDIQPFTASALDIFKKVQVRTFKFKADTTGKTNIGFIADEVPGEMATPQRNGVDQASTVALLVKAVQELTEQNKALQDKISKLEAKMKER